MERKFGTVGTERPEMKRPMYTMLGEKCGVFTPLSSAQIPNEERSTVKLRPHRLIQNLQHTVEYKPGKHAP